MHLPAALKRFIWDFQSVVELAESEREIFLVGRDLMARLLAERDILPPEFAACDASHARKYRLYLDAMQRFSLVSRVLAPGQSTDGESQSCWRIGGVVSGNILRRQFAGDDVGAAVLTGETGQAAGLVETARPAGLTQWINPSQETPAILVQVFGGDPGENFDNGPEAPPFDIWSIQTRVLD